MYAGVGFDRAQSKRDLWTGIFSHGSLCSENGNFKHMQTSAGDCVSISDVPYLSIIVTEVMTDALLDLVSFEIYSPNLKFSERSFRFA